MSLTKPKKAQMRPSLARFEIEKMYQFLIFKLSQHTFLPHRFSFLHSVKITLKPFSYHFSY
jgi:hypothetical protein